MRLLRRREWDLWRERQRWFEDSPSSWERQHRRFCFVLACMPRRWREADRRNDKRGRSADRTVGSTDARREWFPLLGGVLKSDRLIRIRHRYFDEPALLVRESTFRELERAAAGAASL